MGIDEKDFAAWHSMIDEIRAQESIHFIRDIGLAISDGSSNEAMVGLANRAYGHKPEIYAAIVHAVAMRGRGE